MSQKRTIKMRRGHQEACVRSLKGITNQICKGNWRNTFSFRCCSKDWKPGHCATEPPPSAMDVKSCSPEHSLGSPGRIPPLLRSKYRKYNVTTAGGKSVKTKLVQIGNSRGIRLPKSMLAEAQLADEIELRAEPGCILIRSARPPRTGWAEAARRMRELGEDQLTDPIGSTKFDREEWGWH